MLTRLLRLLRSLIAILTGDQYITLPLEAPSHRTPMVQQQMPQARPLAGVLQPAPRYAVRQRLGQGGQARVYRGYDLDTGQIVALKVSDAADLREWHLLRLHSHPALPRCYAGWVAGGKGWLAQEYVPGPTLHRWRLERGGRLPWREVCWIGQQIAQALEYLHGQGMVHLDVKPENLLLTSAQADGGGEVSVKLIDFGAARPIGLPDWRRWGTPAYAPPERVWGAVTPEADVFSLGVVLHELLSGVTPPLSGFTWSPLPPEVPGQLQALVAGMTAPDPRSRPTVAQVGWTLEQRFAAPVPVSGSTVPAPAGAAFAGDPHATLPARS